MNCRECGTCGYWHLDIHWRPEEYRSWGICGNEASAHSDVYMREDFRSCHSWNEKKQEDLMICKERGKFNPKTHVMVEHITEATAERLWTLYLADVIVHVHAEKAAKQRKKKVRKKNRQWGIWHQDYGWGVNNNGLIFRTRRKKEAYQQLSLYRISNPGWKVKRCYIVPAQGGKQ